MKHPPAVRRTDHERRTDPAAYVMALLGDGLTPGKYPDDVSGTLNPIVYALNKGKSILPNSQEHKSLIGLLSKANIC